MASLWSPRSAGDGDSRLRGNDGSRGHCHSEEVDAMQPRVLLLGDSICSSPGYSFGSGGYAPLVAARLRDQGIAVDYYRASGWTTRHFLKLLADGELPTGADIVHFNAGLHDIARPDEASNRVQVPRDEYARNLRAIVERTAGRTAGRAWYGPRQRRCSMSGTAGRNALSGGMRTCSDYNRAAADSDAGAARSRA